MKRLEVSQAEGVRVVRLRGDLVQEDYLEMRAYFSRNFFDVGETTLLIDCDGITELPSIAFGVFCSLARDARRAGGEAALVHVGERIRDIMYRTHVNRQICDYPSLEEAVLAVSGKTKE